MKRKRFIIVSFLLVCCLLPMSAIAEWEEGKVAYITSNSPVNVYHQASRNGYLGEGASKCAYTYWGKSGDWYKIQFADDVVGYVAGNRVAITGSLNGSNIPCEPDAVFDAPR